MKEKPTVVMAERSDIYHDARVQKEATSLANNDYRVEVWGFRGEWQKADMKSNFRLVTFPVISRRFRTLRNINMALNIFIISLVIIGKRADYYHAHNTMFLLAMYLSSKIHQGKYIYDSHEVQWEKGRIQAYLEKLFIQRVDKVINVSEGRAKIQSDRYNLPDSKISIMANYPVVKGNKTEIKQKSDEELHCIFSGGFNLEDNRLDNLVLAIKEIPKIEFSLLSFGYGKSRYKLLEIVKILKISDRVKFLPLVTPDKVIEAISSYDFAVNLLANHKSLISYKYPSINKMYEYLAAGLPVLTSKLPSFIADFENEGVGISVDPDDVNSIKKGLEFFQKNRDKMIVMKHRALVLSKEKYNWETQEKLLLNLYRELAPDRA